MTYPRPRSTPRVPTRCRLRDALKAALILATSVSCAPEQADESLVRLSPVASIPAPLSTNTEITLVDEDTACVINSYEVGSAAATGPDRWWELSGEKARDQGSSNAWAHSSAGRTARSECSICARGG